MQTLSYFYDKEAKWRWLAVLGIAAVFFFGSLFFDRTTAYSIAKQSTITVTVQDGNQSINLMPGNFGKSNDTTVEISTDNYSGYLFQISSDSTTSMTGPNSSAIESIGGEVAESSFVSDSQYYNKWGFRPSQYVTIDSGTSTVTQNTNYLPAPPTTGLTIDKTTTSNDVTNQYTLSFASKINTELPAGTYTHTNILTVIANDIIFNMTYDKNTTDEVNNMPSPNPQEIEIEGGIAVGDSFATLSTARPSRSGKSFKGWCDIVPTEDVQTTEQTCGGTLYKPGDDYPVDQTDAPNIILYATWSAALEDEYAITYHYGDMSFDGNDVIDTKIAPLSADNFNLTNEEYKDFEINFSIDSYTPDTTQNNRRNVVVSNMAEYQPNYTGFDFRYSTSTNRFELEVNSDRSISDAEPGVPISKNTVSYGTPSTLPWAVTLKRTGTNLYLNDVLGMDFSHLYENTNIPITFGAETAQDGKNYYRYFTGELSDITVKMMYDSQTAITLPRPTRTDYAFIGWSTTPNGENIISSVTLEGDIDLYPVWRNITIDGYNVTYNYGSLSFDGTTYLDTNLNLFSSELFLNNFSITTNVVGGEAYPGQNSNFNTVFADMKESNTTLYPGIVYRLKYTDYSFIANMSTGRNNTIGNPTNTPIVVARQNRNIFLNGTQRVDGSEFTETFDIPLTFGAAIGPGDTPFRYGKFDLTDTAVTVQYDKSNAVTLPNPSFEGNHCAFTGWTGDNGTTPELSVTIPAGNTTDKNYTANFDCPTSFYTITFNANNGTSSETARMIPTGEAIGTLPTPTREGYTFEGWYADNTFQDEITASYIPTRSTTIIAKWSVNQYTITFDTAGGSAIASVTQDYGTDIILPVNPTKAGYTFVRWEPSVPATMPAESVTVTAIWKEKTEDEYVVSYDYGDLNFSGSSYLDTGLALFSSDLRSNDFGISLGIVSSTYVTGQSNSFNNVFSIMDESGSPYPGVVFRRNSSSYGFVANSTASETREQKNYDSTSVNAIREGTELLLNGTSFISFANFNSPFTVPLTFGAGLDGNNRPFRYFKGTLGNVRVDVTYNNTTAVTLPTPTFPGSNCIFDGWTNDSITTPQASVTIPVDNSQDLIFEANFTCSAATQNNSMNSEISNEVENNAEQYTNEITVESDEQSSNTSQNTFVKSGDTTSNDTYTNTYGEMSSSDFDEDGVLSGALLAAAMASATTGAVLYSVAKRSEEGK